MVQPTLPDGLTRDQVLELVPKPTETAAVCNGVDKKEKSKSHLADYQDKCQGCVTLTVKTCHEIRRGCQQVDVKTRLRKTFSVQTLKNRLPILKWIPNYRLRHLQGDVIAGLTVGLTVIPQSLAYAKIAELPPQYGLYTSFMACFVYVIFGTSRDINLGPTAVMSLLVAEFAHSIPELAALLALISGLIQFAMGLFHVGFLIEYISHPVINSFTTAAAITIVCSQIKKWLGLTGVPREFVQQFYWTLRKIPEIKLFDFGLGLVCMILLYVMKRIKEIKFNEESMSVGQKICQKLIWVLSTARNAIVVILSAGLGAILYHNDLEPFSLTGNITSGIPPLRLPEFTITTDNSTMSTSECFQSMGIGLVIVPLVGVIESIAIGKAFGRKGGYSIDGNQELLANGVANVLGSFVSAYPVTSSFSRSAVMSQSGVQTTLANIFTGTLVLLALAFLTPLFYYIPTSALAAVIIMAVTDMIDFSMIKHLWIINKVDLFPWFTTFFISLFAGFEYGILIGVVSSLLLLLYPWARPHIQAKPLTESRSGAVGLISPDNVIIVSIPMGLMFPGVDYLQEKVEASVFNDTSSKTVIIDFNHVFRMDYTAVMGLKEMSSYLRKKETPLILANVNPTVLRQLQKAKIKDLCHTNSIEEALQLIAEGGLAIEDMVKIVDENEGNVIHRSVSTLASTHLDESKSMAGSLSRLA